MLDRADLIGFPGGFSFGDDVASGRIFAMHVRERLYPALLGAVERGSCMIGICNGFQVLVQVGLLPGPTGGEQWPRRAPPEQSLSLAENQSGRFVDRWARMSVDPASPCVWTAPLAGVPAEHVTFPSAHGEGRLVGDDETLDRIEAAHQAPLRYEENFNGSARAIAGVCDSSGRVFGLMPHPERFLDWNRHPNWTALPADVRSTPAPGLLLFRSAVEAAQVARV